ncbi:sigma-70 family RNA polymerase sigma factor [Paenibacillus pinihumi]|uniref:sigma-70 family RNA polymerase sigma factor n=1 Tax=Paenibacillus pinihumi TaxID=669462 RepID=UPI00040234D2|nr:sigma-70 family RNA polymerase sigma factor [Paenibacillus pinihumi]
MGLPLEFKEENIEEHFKLVHFTIRKYYKNTKPGSAKYDDMFQQGCIGLLKAIRNYDSGIAKFSTYASRLIRCEISDYLRRDNLVKFPRDTIFLIRRIKKQQLSGSVQEIAEKTQTSPNAVSAALTYLDTSYVSMETPLSVDDSLSFKDMVGQEDDYSSLATKEFISTLSDRDRLVLEWRMQGLKQRQIANEIGVTQTQMHRVLHRIGNLYLKHYA